jgi:hypothetical protein
MTQPLFILSTMRSYTSLISTMLGQHPQAYGFPELNLFVADTVGGMIEYYLPKRPHGLDGLVRTVAELEFGGQNDDTVAAAKDWIKDRTEWETGRMYRHLLKRVAPHMGVDKSPVTVRDRSFLERMLRLFPDAYYLHLTRHPRSVCHSIHRFNLWLDEQRATGLAAWVDPEQVWQRTNQLIAGAYRRLPPGQIMRIQGEQLLGDPDLYLPQIAEWLELDSGPEAIAAMKAPERSPYACLGPEGAMHGNDPNFLDNPRFVQREIPEASLKGPKDWGDASGEFSKLTMKLAKELGYR